MEYVKAKKHLGQHFLKNDQICQRIAENLTGHGGYKQVLEIGPGMGALTKFLLQSDKFTTSVVEIDRESVAYLEKNYPSLKGHIYSEDFLRMKLDTIYAEPFAVAGNFPYNISSQIVFKILDYKDQIPEMVGMFQREVAQRFAGGPGNKEYGIISVLTQAYYDIEYLFTVDETEFIPPPKVKSGVIRMKRKVGVELDCDPKMFKTVVKTAFNQRRKTMRNSLKSLSNGKVDMSDVVFTKRPEQLSVQEFVELTKRFMQD
ncbi:MAG: 16S rRNA (adenine(1518)-N(6)/adenine(1519)-N(6))-dimethyltransferase RsmA [Flavobacteriales bacterium]